MTVPRIDLDLSRPASDRWASLAPHVEKARRLLDCYVRDLGGLGAFAPLIEPYAQAFVSGEHREEIGSIARMIGRPEPEVLLGNLYYEAFRQLIAGRRLPAIRPTVPFTHGTWTGGPRTRCWRD